MRQQTRSSKEPAEKVVQDIRRATRKQYSAEEKIRIVLEGLLRIPRSTFYRWCDQYQTGGPEALDDRSPRPDRVWNRIPDDVRECPKATGYFGGGHCLPLTFGR